MSGNPTSNPIMNATLDYLIRYTHCTGFVGAAEVAAVLLALRELKERRSADETTEPCRQCSARAPSYCSNCGIAIEPLKLPSGGSNG